MTRAEVIEMINTQSNPIARQKLKEVLEVMDNFKKEEHPLINDLAKLGIVVESVWDLVNNRPHPMLKSNFTGGYEIAYPVLVRHLDYGYHPKIQEGIIRALTEKAAKETAKDKLLELFYKEKNSNVKWALANALKTLMTWQQRQKHPEIANVQKGTNT